MATTNTQRPQHNGAMVGTNLQLTPPNPNAKYHLHIDLDHAYTPLKKRRGGDHISETVKTTLREGGARHVDLWCDGSLYPKDPHTNSTPPFSNPTTLLRFVGDGKEGLLNYCKSISTMSAMMHEENTRVHKLKMECNLKEEKINTQQQEITWLNQQLQILRQKQTVLGPRQRRRKLKNIEDLKVGSGGIKKRIRAVRLISSFMIFLYYVSMLNIVPRDQGCATTKQGEL